jgi:replicative DNA helicase
MTEIRGNRSNRINFPTRNRKKAETMDLPLPHNLDAERGLIGAILRDSSLYDEISTQLRSDHFFDPFHQQIWAEMARALDAGGIASPTLLQSKFAPSDSTGNESVKAYLDGLTAARSLAVGPYAAELAELAARRRFIALAERVNHAARDAGLRGSIHAVFEEELAKLSGMEHGAKTIALNDEYHGICDQAAEAFRSGAGISGLETGMPELDRLIGGIDHQHFVLVGGRPSHGKTALALQWGFHQAKTGHPVGFISLETSSTGLARRLFAAQVGIPANHIKRGIFKGEDDLRRMQAVARENKGIPFYIVEPRGALTPGRLRTIAQRLIRRHGIEALYIDYVQLMAPDESSRSRYVDVTAVSSGIRGVIQDLNIPVIGMAQLSRAIEGRREDDQMPRLSDLRETGQLEQDADLAVFVHRPEKMLDERKPAETDRDALEKWKDKKRQVRGHAYAILAKNKDGETGQVKLRYQAELMKFTEPAVLYSALEQFPDNDAS